MAHFDDVIDAINRALDSGDVATANTSMRIPVALRDAAAAIEAIAIQAVLDNHYREHPYARPSLADLAIAAAELDGHPLAGDPERIRRAATELVERHPDADCDDVLLWAEARMLAAA